MNSNIKSTVYLILLGMQTACCFLLDISQENGHIGGWSDWKCQKQAEICFKSRTCNTTSDFNCSRTSEVNITSCPCVAEWSPWGGWTCHTDHDVCLKLRKRTCISGFKENDCLMLKGKSYEETYCDNFCNSTTNVPIETTITASVNSGLYTPPSTEATTITPMASIMSSQKPPSTSDATSFMSKSSPPQSELKTSTQSTATFDVTSNHSTISTNTATSKPFSTSKTIGMSSAAYIYWLEWTGWECKDSTSFCLMSRTRNCSTFKTYDCEEKLGGDHFHVEPCKKEICPASWSDWNTWTCRIEKTGPCNMTRSRKCSTGPDAGCGFNSLEHKPCDDVTCPELKKLGILGHCKYFDSFNCSDAEACKNPNILLICFADAHVASKICPKACGCCHVDPQWTPWSDWRCERTLTMCRMKQKRTCSTGNKTDCKGVSEREAVCDESICPEPKWESWSAWKCQ
ncbi:semaphorin-5B-like [Ruditapes philippinarum]|uniref:semaphorin-5B-like n=1 Tax=Ruditapes philippinarum TaxID=129788 RepID=UPI00295B252C|nr:semaphorin-5B-like [Ruditapes philippinarum]